MSPPHCRSGDRGTRRVRANLSTSSHPASPKTWRSHFRPCLAVRAPVGQSVLGSRKLALERAEGPLDTQPTEFGDVIVEDCAPDDHDGCIEVFQTNQPLFFTPEELDLYRSFLNALPGPYLVVRDPDRRIVACGGYALRESGTVADMCWGMVRRDLHGLGIGKTLTRARVERIRSGGGVREITLNTSQHTLGFYQRLGFEVVEVLTDGYAEGLDRCEMRLVLTGGDR